MFAFFHSFSSLSSDLIPMKWNKNVGRLANAAPSWRKKAGLLIPLPSELPYGVGSSRCPEARASLRRFEEARKEMENKKNKPPKKHLARLPIRRNYARKLFLA